jgi:uncharacterized RDD family membrane protein YckC
MQDREPSMLGTAGTGLGNGTVVLPDGPPAASSDSRSPASRSTPSPSTGAAGDAPVVWAAGFWRRAAAAILDGIFVMPLVLAVVLSASKLAGLNLPALRRGSLDTWLDLALAGDPGFLGALGLGVAVVAVYLFLFQALAARTIGMRMMGLTVIDLGGAPIVPWRAGLRTLGYLVGLATLGLGFIWVGFDREKRGLHDWLAGTLVIKSPPQGGGRPPPPGVRKG